MSTTPEKRTRTLLGYCLLIALALPLVACNDDNPPRSSEPLSYPVSGAVTGLSASGLALTINGGTPLSVSAGAALFAFLDPLPEGTQYNVAVSSQPSAQICTVVNGTGVVRGTVNGIQVTCNAETHSVAGSVSGLSTGGLVLQLNGADDLTIPANADGFEFETPIAAGSSYHVTVLTQPAGLTCAVNNGAASNINADIGNVQVVCSATSHAVSGTVAGLTGAGLILQNNGVDDTVVPTGASSFEFASRIADGGTYSVTVLSPPAGQTCSIANGTGTAQSNISNIAVTCANIPVYTVTPAAGPNGSIAPNVPLTVNQGASAVFTATSDVGYTVSQWLVDGSPVQTGGSMYTLANVSANATVQVEFGTVALTASVSAIALSVNKPTPTASLTGSARTVTITNVGSASATNVSVSAPAFPSGTVMSANSCSATLAAGSSCSITITPGANATSSCTSGTAPTPDAVTVSADNAPDVTFDVTVLGYGCLYQGGYVFAVDDTTPATSSIGGTVIATVDQTPPAPNGVVWSSNGASGTAPDVDFSDVGVSVDDVAPCNSAYDGACNSSRILSHYPAPPYPRAYFAAGQCAATIGGYSDWYLPASCELGVCAPLSQNIMMTISLLGVMTGHYWSSTESSTAPHIDVQATYVDGGASYNYVASKDNELSVRCARALTQ